MSNTEVVKNYVKIRKLWAHLSSRRKKQFWLILILMILSAISEIISIGAILPFLGVLTSPSKVFEYPPIQPIIQFLEISNASQLIPYMTVFFVAAVLLAGLVRLTLLYTMTRFSYATGADISINVYRRTLYQEYTVHVSRNSSEIINSMITKTNTVIQGVLNPILIFISSIFIVIGIVSALISINVSVALSAFVGFGLLYSCVIYYTRNQVKNNSKIIADKSTLMIKSLQEGLGGIRDVLIDRTQHVYCKIYQDADLPLRRASGDNHFISICPRYVMEAVGMTLIAGFAYVLTQQENGLITAIPTLGALALGSQRLLPALQQMYSSYSQIRGASSSLEDVLSLLDQPVPTDVDTLPPEPIKFETEIKLKNLSFHYKTDKLRVLKNITLSLSRGDHIGFVGESGSGKSTLLDIIMGLLVPTSGSIIIDHEPINSQNITAWQTHIAHVPQSIYLSDGTIEENIAFGVSKDRIDTARVREAAKAAQLSTLIDELGEGYQTFVGERGIFLSGGQRQRIGIARALYKKADVLILDEATSALDNETELKVMEAIYEIDKKTTVFIVAHRLSTLQSCNKIIKLHRDGAIQVLSYDDLVKN
jgi:ATP-binding cassette, subfamily B, bacterial PglK